MRWVHLFGAASLLGFASPVFACSLPPLVVIPAKDDVGDRAPILKEATYAYFESMRVYTMCVQAELAAAGPDVSPQLKALLIARNNSAVAEAEAVARLFEDNVELRPIFTSPPEYPARALSRGLEGWVEIQFTITPAGTVTDAVVVNAEPKGLFDEAALKSIAAWRYNPRVEGGVAVARVGKTTIIRFHLEP